MSKRRDVLNHLRQLQEIGEIMRAMENLATVESRKMSRLIQSQRRLMDEMRMAAAELYQHFPALRPAADDLDVILIAVGSERGFCGDFNETILSAAQGASSHHLGRLICVGSKLIERLPRTIRPIASLPGPSVADEVSAVVAQVVRELSDLHDSGPPTGLTVLYHGGERGELVELPVLPLSVAETVTDAGRAYPPLLHCSPDQFLGLLLDEYVLGALYEVFYGSLAAENQQRMHHLQGAVDRLEERTTALVRTSRALRQEEITEEIEVILLSAGEQPWG